MASDAAERVRSIVAAAESEAARLRYEAERDAQAHLRGAEEQSIRFLDEAKLRAEGLVEERRRRIQELSGQIVESSRALLERIDNAAAVRTQLDALVHALGETADRVAREGGRTPGESVQAPAPVQPPAFESPVPQPQSEPPVPEPPTPPAPSDPVPEHPGDAEQQQPASHGPPPESEGRSFDGARLVALQMAVAGNSREEVEAHMRRAFGLEDPQSILDDVFGAAGRRRRSETRRRAVG